MESKNKPRVIKDYEKLSEEMQEQIKLAYPFGFSDHLIGFYNKDGLRVSALPFETEDRIYLVRMSVAKAQKIVNDDDDYDDLGVLKDDVREEYEDKYDDQISGDDEPSDDYDD